MTPSWITYLAVALGGALGSVVRFWVGGWVGGAKLFGTVAQTFPLGTLLVNISGSFLIGLIAAFTNPEGGYPASPTFRTFLMVGICGGYTTFSSFSLQTLNLVQEGQWLYAGANIALSVVLCLVAVWLGHTAGLLLQPR